MNIAWLTPEIPYPPIGGRNGVYNRIVQLSKYNTIHLFSIAYTEEEKNSSGEMKKYCVDVKYYNRNESKFKKIIKSITTPYSVASRTLPALKLDLRELLKKEKIDVIIVDFPNMAKNLIGIIDNDQYCSLNQHNIEYQRMREMIHIKTIPFYKRLAYYLESYRLERYEERIYRKGLFRSITFFSKDDIELFKKRWNANTAKLRLFPLGANNIVSSFKKTNKHNMLFVGRLDDIAIPNVEAALWFVNNVFPLIKKEIADAKIIIGGANPSKKIWALKNESVEIIPNYENLEKIYSLSDIVLLPLQSGGGVKGKLLEAAAFNKIIISTDHGIEGTEFEPDEHILLGNTPQEFAQRCIDVLSETKKYYKMSDNANLLFIKHYSWNNICKNYNEFLKAESKRI